MKTKTGEDFEKQVKDKKISSWMLRQCSICDAPLEFIFDDGDVFYDANCDCASFRTMPEPRTYDDIAEIYNRNIGNIEWIKEINEFFGFNE